MGDKEPPDVEGAEYPEKPPAVASMTEKMKWMEQVDYYWNVRGEMEDERRRQEEEEEG